MTTLFHPLTVRRIDPDTAEAVIVTFDVPADLRATFGFTQGQYLTLRHTIDGQDLRRSYSICAGVDDGELRVGVRKVKGGVFSNWINEFAQGRRQHPGDGAAGPVLRAAGPGGTAPPCRHRRRQRHHADPVDHEDGAGSVNRTAASP
jgi:NAD(P)H-flavin reductase